MDDYRDVEKEGVTVAIINGGKILLLKRRMLPFTPNGGLWYFVAGGRKRGEEYIDTAYRELREETAIAKEHTYVLAHAGITILERSRKKRWENMFFVLHTTADDVRINIEHTAFKWVTLPQLVEEHRETLECISNEREVLDLLKSCIEKERA